MQENINGLYNIKKNDFEKKYSLILFMIGEKCFLHHIIRKDI